MGVRCWKESGLGGRGVPCGDFLNRSRAAKRVRRDGRGGRGGLDLFLKSIVQRGAEVEIPELGQEFRIPRGLGDMGIGKEGEDIARPGGLL